MNFKEWLQLQEVGTGTGDIAGFSQRWGPGGDNVVRRKWVNDDEDEHKKHKKKHKKHHFFDK